MDREKTALTTISIDDLIKDINIYSSKHGKLIYDRINGQVILSTLTETFVFDRGTRKTKDTIVFQGTPTEVNIFLKGVYFEAIYN